MLHINATLKYKEGEEPHITTPINFSVAKFFPIFPTSNTFKNGINEWMDSEVLV